MLLFLAPVTLCRGNADSLLTSLQRKHTPETKVDLLNNLADLYVYRNLDSAMSFAQEAMIDARNAGYQKGEIIALINKSEIYREMGKYKEAMIQTERVKKYSENLTDKDLLAKFYMLSGNNYMFQHTYNQALEQYEKSFALFRECNDLIGMGDVQRKMSQLFSYRGETETMYEYILSALKCYQQAGYQRGIEGSMHNIAMYLIDINDFEEAKAYLYKAISMNVKEGNIFWLSKNYFTLSRLMEMMNQPDSVLYLSLAALNLARKVGNPYYEFFPLMQMGYLNKQQNNNGIALKYYQEALKLAEQINSFDNLSMISDSINQIYYKMGFIDSAYLYQKKHYEYVDSLNQNNSNVRFTELKYQLEMERNQQKIALQNQKRIFISLLIFTALSLTIAILFLLNARQKIKIRNTQLEKEVLANNMELKNKELANNILGSQKKNEAITTIIQNIEGNRNLFPKESHELLDQVIHNLSATVEESGWEEFELIFSQVHESFFTGLDRRYPDLSAKERRLCALLRLNMSSKEIAEVTRLTPASVDTARCRLRKKLGIENLNTDLISFLGKL